MHEKEELASFHGIGMPSEVSMFDEDDYEEGISRKIQVLPLLPSKSIDSITPLDLFYNDVN